MLWQQTKVVSLPSTILLVLTYLSCISGLHIISSPVVQFEAFSNAITSIVPSTLAWPFSSINPMNIDWATVSPLTALSLLLSTAKGLTGNMLYDVPITDYPYAGGIVNMSTISAECGLLSNTSVGNWNNDAIAYSVNVSGLGELAMFLTGIDATPDFPSCLSSISGPNVVTPIVLASVSSSKPDYRNICIKFLVLSTVQQLHSLPDPYWGRPGKFDWSSFSS